MSCHTVPEWRCLQRGAVLKPRPSFGRRSQSGRMPTASSLASDKPIAFLILPRSSWWRYRHCRRGCGRSSRTIGIEVVPSKRTHTLIPPVLPRCHSWPGLLVLALALAPPAWHFDAVSCYHCSALMSLARPLRSYQRGRRASTPSLFGLPSLRSAMPRPPSSRFFVRVRTLRPLAASAAACTVRRSR